MVLATLEGGKLPAADVKYVSGHKSAAPVDDEKLHMLWNIAQESGADLSPGQKDLFYHLLLSYADVMSYSTSDLGRTDKLQHCIPTGNGTPIRQPVRRVPRQEDCEFATTIE